MREIAGHIIGLPLTVARAIGDAVEQLVLAAFGFAMMFGIYFAARGIVRAARRSPAWAAFKPTLIGIAVAAPLIAIWWAIALPR